MARQNIELATSGMHCGSCAMLIDMTLRDIEGVEESSTDLASGTTSVTYDDETVDPESLVQAVRGVGYDAEVKA